MQSWVLESALSSRCRMPKDTGIPGMERKRDWYTKRRRSRQKIFSSQRILHLGPVRWSFRAVVRGETRKREVYPHEIYGK